MKNKIVVWLIAVVMFVLCLPTNVFTFIANAETIQTYSFFDEMWDYENETFNIEVVEEVITLLTLDSEGNQVDYPVDKLYELAAMNTSYTDIMKNLGLEEANVRIPLSIGGLTWLPMYLSNDKDGNVILSLWLSETQQEQWRGYLDGYKVEEDSSLEVFNGALYSNYGVDENYMYSTSLIRSYGLNNNSSAVYIGEDGEGNPIYSTYSARNDHPFSLFTSNTSSLTDYIVTPRNVVWQEYQNINPTYFDGYGAAEYLNLIYSLISFCDLMFGKEAVIEEFLSAIEQYANIIMTNMISAANECWTDDIVNAANHEEFNKMLTYIYFAFDKEIANATSEEEKQAILAEKAEIEAMMQLFMPYVAVDKYGNYYNFYNTGGLNYQGYEHNGDWADDYLWLPSASEAAATQFGINSLWETDDDLLINNAEEIDASQYPYTNNTLVRSAVANGVGVATPNATDYTFVSNDTMCAVRPAFHLNLTKIIKEFNLEETKSQYIRIEEIWDEENQDFNTENLEELYSYISGQENADLLTVKNVLSNSEKGVLTAKDFKSNAVGKKSENQSVIVKIGGYEWYATYLSNSKKDEPTLTLWLSNSFQGKNTYNKKVMFDILTGYCAGSVFSVSETDLYSFNPLRFFGLNNKADIFIGNSSGYNPFEVDEYGYYHHTAKEDHPFSLFTNENFGFTQYLTTPRNIEWQEYQNCNDICGLGSFSNDAWADDIVNGENNFNFELSINYSGEEYNSDWADDYLWLPSIGEVVCHEAEESDLNDISLLGLWELSSNQFKNYNGVDAYASSIMGELSNIPTAYFLRSGAVLESQANLLTVSVDGTEVVTNNTEAMLRPAMHLNLESIVTSVEQEGVKLISSRSVYNGSSKLANIGFSFEETTLLLNTDYVFTCFLKGEEVSDIVESGTYTIVFNGLGDYIDYQNIEFTYTVSRQNIVSQATVNVLEIPPFIQGETENVEPIIDVYYGENKLTQDVDYILTFSNNTTPTARAKYVVTFIGNYIGTIKGNFIIAGIDLSVVNVDSELTNTRYTSDLQTEHKYSPGEIYAENILLTENIDYIWYYYNAENPEDKTGQNLPENYFVYPGIIVIAIEGMGIYTGTDYISYYITEVDSSSVDVVYNIEDYYEYTGLAYCPTLTASYNGYDLIEGVDYIVSYRNNVDASTEWAKAEIIVIFKGNFIGSKSYYFTIYPRSIVPAELENEIPEYSFISSGDLGRIYFEFSLVYDGIKLEKNIDYTYSPQYVINAGTHTITVTGKGNYKETKQLTVKVNKAQILEVNIYSNADPRPNNKSFYYQEGVPINTNHKTMVYVHYLKPDGTKGTETLTNLELFPKDKYKAYRNGVETTDFESIGDITFKFFNLTTNNIEQPEGEYYAQVLSIVPDVITEAYLSDGYTMTYFTYDRGNHKVGTKVSTHFVDELSQDFYKVYYYKYDNTLEDFSPSPLEYICEAGRYEWRVVSISPLYQTTAKAKGEVWVFSKSVESLYYEYYYVNEQGQFTNELGEVVNEKFFVTPTTGSYAGLPLEVDVYFSSSKSYKLQRGVEYNVVRDDSLLQTDNKFTIKISAVTGTSYTGEISTEFNKNLYRIDLVTKKVTANHYYNLGNAVTVDPENLTLFNTDNQTNLVYGQDYVYYSGEITVGSSTKVVDIYENNINVGTATLYIQGINSYIGITTVTFKINPLDILSEKITGQFSFAGGEYTYVKQQIKPEVTHDYLVKETDYNVNYFDNTDVGSASAVVSGKGNFTGSTTFNFEIIKKSIADSNIIFSPAIKESYVYTGVREEFKNTLKLYYNLSNTGYVSLFLKEEIDYKITYFRDGVETTNCLDVGSMRIVFAGRGNFEDEIEIEYNIVSKDITDPMQDKVEDNYVYKRGNSVKVELFDRDYKMVENLHYTISFYRNGNLSTDLSSAGLVTYVVYGIGNYKGTLSGGFIIEKGKINGFAQDTYSYVFNRYAQEPKPLDVYDANGQLIDQEEYILQYYKFNSVEQSYDLIDINDVDFISPAEYKIVATVNSQKNNYEGSCEAIYKIEKKSLKELIGQAQIDEMFKDQYFTNTEIEQKVEINFGDYGLVEGEDYEVKYENNKETGDVSVKIEGIGDYKDSFDTSFEITSKPLEDIVIDDGVGISNLVIAKEYTGENVSLENRDFAGLIRYGDGSLVAGVDFTYSYADEERVELGNYVVTLTGMGNYKNSVDITMRIVSIKFEDSLELTDIPEFVYANCEYQPIPTFYIHGSQKDLVKDVDYKIAYKDNKNAGKATLTVTGIGHYSGVLSKEFIISPAVISLENEKFDISYTNSFVYSAEAVNLDLLIKYNPLGEEFTINYGVEYGYSIYDDVNNNQKFDSGVDQIHSGAIVNAGAYLIKILGNGTNYIGEVSLPITVEKLNVEDAVANSLMEVSGVAESYVYMAEQINPQTLVYFKGINVTENSFDITYAENKNVLTGGTVIITAKLYSNFVGSITKTFEITKATINIEVELLNKEEVLHVGGFLPAIKVVNDSIEGTLSWKNSGEVLLLGKNSYKWVFTPLDTDNYNVVEGTIEITAVSVPLPIGLIVGVGVGLLMFILLIILLKKKKKKQKEDNSPNNNQFQQINQMKQDDVTKAGNVVNGNQNNQNNNLNNPNNNGAV